MHSLCSLIVAKHNYSDVNLALMKVVCWYTKLRLRLIYHGTEILVQSFLAILEPELYPIMRHEIPQCIFAVIYYTEIKYIWSVEINHEVFISMSLIMVRTCIICLNWICRGGGGGGGFFRDESFIKHLIEMCLISNIMVCLHIPLASFNPAWFTASSSHVYVKD